MWTHVRRYHSQSLCCTRVAIALTRVFTQSSLPLCVEPFSLSLFLSDLRVFLSVKLGLTVVFN